MGTVPQSKRFEAGGYFYLPAVFQYSGGVAAAPGFAMVRSGANYVYLTLNGNIIC